MEYTVIYSKRRTLCLQIKGDYTILVKAPYGISQEKIASFVSSHKGWIEKAIGRLESKPKIDNLTKEEILNLKKQTQEIITPIIELYSKKMDVSPLGVSINSAKTRFGSCSSKKKLNFSCRLALYPLPAIEYVCVHELAHLYEMNHSKKFWQIVEKYLPDYKSRKAMLK